MATTSLAIVPFERMPRFVAPRGRAAAIARWDPYVVLALSEEQIGDILRLVSPTASPSGRKLASVRLKQREARVREAYLELAAKFHPDTAYTLPLGARSCIVAPWLSIDDHFSAIGSAYRLLLDPVATVEYLVAADKEARPPECSLAQDPTVVAAGTSSFSSESASAEDRISAGLAAAATLPRVPSRRSAAAGGGRSRKSEAFALAATDDEMERMARELRRAEAEAQRGAMAAAIRHAYALHLQRMSAHGDGFFVTAALYGDARAVAALVSECGGGRPVPPPFMFGAAAAAMGEPVAGTAASSRVLDVAGVLQTLVEVTARDAGSEAAVVQLSLAAGSKAAGAVDGLWDPAEGEPKALWMRYEFLGRVHEVAADDEAPVKCPLRKHLVKGARARFHEYVWALQADRDERAAAEEEVEALTATGRLRGVGAAATAAGAGYSSPPLSQPQRQSSPAAAPGTAGDRRGVAPCDSVRRELARLYATAAVAPSSPAAAAAAMYALSSPVPRCRLAAALEAEGGSAGSDENAAPPPPSAALSTRWAAASTGAGGSSNAGVCKEERPALAGAQGGGNVTVRRGNTPRKQQQQQLGDAKSPAPGGGRHGARLADAASSGANALPTDSCSDADPTPLGVPSSPPPAAAAAAVVLRQQQRHAALLLLQQQPAPASAVRVAAATATAAAASAGDDNGTDADDERSGGGGGGGSDEPSVVSFTKAVNPLTGEAVVLQMTSPAAARLAGGGGAAARAASHALALRSHRKVGAAGAGVAAAMGGRRRRAAAAAASSGAPSSAAAAAAAAAAAPLAAPCAADPPADAVVQPAPAGIAAELEKLRQLQELLQQHQAAVAGIAAPNDAATASATTSISPASGSAALGWAAVGTCVVLAAAAAGGAYLLLSRSESAGGVTFLRRGASAVAAAAAVGAGLATGSSSANNTTVAVASADPRAKRRGNL